MDSGEKLRRDIWSVTMIRRLTLTPEQFALAEVLDPEGDRIGYLSVTRVHRRLDLARLEQSENSPGRLYFTEEIFQRVFARAKYCAKS
jgi:hypothetical protein